MRAHGLAQPKAAPPATKCHNSAIGVGGGWEAEAVSTCTPLLPHQAHPCRGPRYSRPTDSRSTAVLPPQLRCYSRTAIATLLQPHRYSRATTAVPLQPRCYSRTATAMPLHPRCYSRPIACSSTTTRSTIASFASSRAAISRTCCRCARRCGGTAWPAPPTTAATVWASLNGVVGDCLAAAAATATCCCCFCCPCCEGGGVAGSNGGQATAGGIGLTRGATWCCGCSGWGAGTGAGCCWWGTAGGRVAEVAVGAWLACGLCRPGWVGGGGGGGGRAER